MLRNTDRSLTQLVSYPRTGSHWLRVIVEQYLSKPCLPESFFDTDLNNPWAYHLHDRIIGDGDEGFTDNFDKVIYLYRNPIDTIYSLVRYEQTQDWESIATEYHNHLTRWLYNHDDCKRLISIKYEDIKNNYQETFKQIFDFLDVEYNEELLKNCYEKTTHHKVKTLTQHNEQIVNNDIFNGKYLTDKSQFKEYFGENINEMFEGIYK